jgi:hypothetical protein
LDEVLITPHRKKLTILRNIQRSLGIELVLRHNLSNGKPRRRWENNIKMDLWEFGRGDIDWIDLTQDSDRWRALVNAVMKLWVP